MRNIFKIENSNIPCVYTVTTITLYTKMYLIQKYLAIFNEKSNNINHV